MPPRSTKGSNYAPDDEGRKEEKDEAWQSVGHGMMGCGCLMTLLITVPLIIIILLGLL